MRLALIITALWGLFDCSGDETVAAYGAADVVWQLHELDGQSYSEHATLSFPEPGKLAGTAPCNTYFGVQAAPYPWFVAENIASTRRICTDMVAETAYLVALSEMSLVEVLGNTLILSNDVGRKMVFTEVE